MSDASSIRRVYTSTPSESQVGAAFYEGAIRFFMNGSNYTVNDAVTGKPRVTGQANINSGSQWVPVGNVVLNVSFPVAADAVSQVAFIADRPYNVVSVQEAHSVVGGSGATAQLYKASGTTAIGSGTAITTAAFSLTSTINTVQTGTLSATTANTVLAAGDRLGLVFAGTVTGVDGLVTIVLQPA